MKKTLSKNLVLVSVFHAIIIASIHVRSLSALNMIINDNTLKSIFLKQKQMFIEPKRSSIIKQSRVYNFDHLNHSSDNKSQLTTSSSLLSFIEECEEKVRSPAVKAFRSATVLKATAIESFNFVQLNTSKTKTYSVLFKVERTYKLNGVLIDSAAHKANFSIPLVTKTKSFLDAHILIRSFNVDEARGCYSSEVKLNHSYFLFLHEKTDLKYEIRPIKLQSNDLEHMESVDNAEKSRKKNFTSVASTWSMGLKKQRLLRRSSANNFKLKTNRGHSSPIVLVKVPVYRMASSPAEAFDSVEMTLKKTLCDKCGNFSQNHCQL